MPHGTAAQVQKRIRRFIIKISFGNITVWTHCVQIVGAKLGLTDLLLQNLVLLLATSQQFGQHVDFTAVQVEGADNKDSVVSMAVATVTSRHKTGAWH